jgi:hypothetical protein
MLSDDLKLRESGEGLVWRFAVNTLRGLLKLHRIDPGDGHPARLAIAFVAQIPDRLNEFVMCHLQLVQLLVGDPASLTAGADAAMLLNDNTRYAGENGRACGEADGVPRLSTMSLVTASNRANLTAWPRAPETGATSPEASASRRHANNRDGSSP